MSDPEKTEALFLAAAQQEARTKYEALLNEVLDAVHEVINVAGETDPALADTVDDSKVHGLLQRLRDEFGPEVSA